MHFVNKKPNSLTITIKLFFSNILHVFVQMNNEFEELVQMQITAQIYREITSRDTKINLFETRHGVV